MGYLDYTHYIYLTETNTRYPFRVIHDRSIAFMEFAHEMAVKEVEKYLSGFSVISSKVGYIGDSKFNKIKRPYESDNWEGHANNYIFHRDKNDFANEFRTNINKLHELFRKTTFGVDIYVRGVSAPSVPADDFLFAMYGRSGSTESIQFRYFVNMISDILSLEGRLFYISGGLNYIPKMNSGLNIDEFMKYYGKSYYFELYAYVNPEIWCNNLLQRMINYISNTIDTFGREAVDVLQLYSNIEVLKEGLS